MILQKKDINVNFLNKHIIPETNRSKLDVMKMSHLKK